MNRMSQMMLTLNFEMPLYTKTPPEKFTRMRKKIESRTIGSRSHLCPQAFFA